MTPRSSGPATPRSDRSPSGRSSSGHPSSKPSESRAASTGAAVPAPSVSPASPVPLLDVNRGNRPLRQEMLDAVAAVLDSGRFLHGPEVDRLERTIAERSHVSHAIGCASGSDALLLSLMAMGIGPGDEVIVPSFTFFATASAVVRVGAKVVFADIDPVTYNLCPNAVQAAITSATRAIIPVHLFGQCADMDAIMRLAADRDLRVVEDACQSIDATWRGRPAGSIGDVGCFSFYPTKNLGGCGDGGMLTTNDDELADRLRLFASHGMRPRYHHRVVGINSRLDTIQAALLEVKLRHLNDATSTRRRNAARYDELFENARLLDAIERPGTSPAADHVWNQYGIRVLHGRRDALRAHLASLGIGSEVYYPVPLHLQECFQSLGHSLGSLPETERAAAEVLHLPIYPELTDAEQDRVVSVIAEFLIGNARAAA